MGEGTNSAVDGVLIPCAVIDVYRDGLQGVGLLGKGFEVCIVLPVFFEGWVCVSNGFVPYLCS